MKKQQTLHRPVTAQDVVQIALMPELVEDFYSRKISYEQMIEQVFSLAKEGYNVNVSFDLDRQQFSVRLAGIDESCTNAKKLLYGNGASVVLAFVSIYIKHFLASKAGKWAPTTSAFSDMS